MKKKWIDVLNNMDRMGNWYSFGIHIYLEMNDDEKIR